MFVKNNTTTRQVARINLRSPTAIVAATKNTTKRFTSSTANSSPPPAGDDPTMKNVVLAAGLFGFVASVFFYSLNAVGRGEENLDGELDPLATLKAEKFNTARASLSIKLIGSGVAVPNAGV